MARMGAACIISSGYGLKDGMAATMTVFPVVPDFEKYPKWGRDHNYTMGEPGSARPLDQITPSRNVHL